MSHFGVLKYFSICKGSGLREMLGGNQTERSRVVFSVDCSPVKQTGGPFFARELEEEVLQPVSGHDFIRRGDGGR